jgi:tRNA (guanine37-N1)-methyltransferase
MKKSYKFSVITIFPELFKPFLEVGVLGKAVKNKILEFDLINPRDFTTDNYNSVDDEPYGGGAGMVFKPYPLYKSIKKAKETNNGKVVYLTPSGKPFTSGMAKQYASNCELIILCGRYEGIDQRIIDLFVDEEISIGDYVLSGGELAAMCISDAIARNVKGVVKEKASVVNDSFYSGLLDHPHYTRPETFNGLKVPDVY